MTTTINERDAVAIAIRTAHGYLSLQPTGAIEFRSEAGPYETFTLEGLASLLAAPPSLPPAASGQQPPVGSGQQLPVESGQQLPVGSGQQPPAVSGHVNNDAIDLSRAFIAARDCPDVRHWPIFAPLTLVEFAATERFERGDTMVDFPGRDALPTAKGSQGPIAFTLWMGCRVDGTWHIVPIVECVRTYVPTGRMLAPNQVATNLFYYVDPPLRGYQPSPGEPIALFCTTGDTRRQNAQAVQSPARTNVVVVPFEAGRHVWPL